MLKVISESCLLRLGALLRTDHPSTRGADPAEPAPRRLRAGRGLLAVALVAGLLLAACGSSTPSRTTQRSSPTSAASSKASRVTPADISALTRVPVPAIPQTAVDAKALHGKTVWVITVYSSPQISVLTAGIQEAASAAGLAVRVVNGNDDAETIQQGVTTAIAAKAAAIMVVEVDVQEAAEAGRTAAKAGIPVVAVQVFAEGSTLPTGVVAQTLFPDAVSGKAMGEYVAYQLRNAAHATEILVPTFPASKALTTELQSLLATFRSYCTNCVAKVDRLPYSDISGPAAASAMSADLARYPKAGWVVAPFDTFALYAVQAIKAAGSPTKVVSVDGAAPNLTYVQRDHIQVADVVEGSQEEGWAAVDAAMRAILHRVTPNFTELGAVRLVTSSQLKNVNVNDQGALMGTGYKAEFLKLWGVG